MDITCNSISEAWDMLNNDLGKDQDKVSIEQFKMILLLVTGYVYFGDNSLVKLFSNVVITIYIFIGVSRNLVPDFLLCGPRENIRDSYYNIVKFIKAFDKFYNQLTTLVIHVILNVLNFILIVFIYLFSKCCRKTQVLPMVNNVEISEVDNYINNDNSRIVNDLENSASDNANDLSEISQSDIVSGSDDFDGQTENDSEQLLSYNENEKSDILVKLEACYILSPNKFCFIRCLNLEDRIIFLNKYAELLEKCSNRYNEFEIILSGAMRMNIWKSIMEAIRSNLSCSYKLHRYAYWGENASKQRISKVITNYTVQLAEFKSTKSNVLVHIIHTTGHLKQISASEIIPSRWRNPIVSSNVWVDVVMEYVEDIVEYISRVFSNMMK